MQPGSLDETLVATHAAAARMMVSELVASGKSLEDAKEIALKRTVTTYLPERLRPSYETLVRMMRWHDLPDDVQAARAEAWYRAGVAGGFWRDTWWNRWLYRLTGTVW